MNAFIFISLSVICCVFVVSTGPWVYNNKDIYHTIKKGLYGLLKSDFCSLAVLIFVDPSLKTEDMFDLNQGGAYSTSGVTTWTKGTDDPFQKY